MTSTKFKDQDPYNQLVAKLIDQLPAIQVKLPANYWEPFHAQLQVILKSLNDAKDDSERHAAIEQIRSLSHYPQDFFLVAEIQIGVFRGTPFESSSHPISNRPAPTFDPAQLQAQITQLLELSAGIVHGDVIGRDKIDRDQINIQNLTINHGTPAALESLGTSKSIIEEKIRLDVAYPEKSVVNQAFSVAVAVLQPDAPQLVPSDFENIASGTGVIFRPSGQELVAYKIELKAPGCDVDPENLMVQLRAGKNSPVVVFLVTAKTSGLKKLSITAYQDSMHFAAQTIVNVDIEVGVSDSAIMSLALREKMGEWLGLTDLKAVCFDMGIDYENLEGNKSDRIMGLITFCKQRNKMEELLSRLRQVNSERDWVE